jgi:hypothetical protein
MDTDEHGWGMEIKRSQYFETGSFSASWTKLRVKRE